MIPLFLMTPMTIEPMPRASMAKKSPNQETPRRSVGILSNLLYPANGNTTIKRKLIALFHNRKGRWIDSAAATPEARLPPPDTFPSQRVL